MLEKLLAALRQQRPDLYKGIETKVNDKSVTEDEVLGLLTGAMALMIQSIQGLSPGMTEAHRFRQESWLARSF